MSFLKKPAIIFCLLSVFFGALLLTNQVYAQARSIQTKYFTVNYYEGCDLTRLADKLDVRHFLNIDMISQGYSTKNITSLISQAVDAIYLEVCDILDIHIYSLKGVINILPDTNSVARIIAQYSGKSISSPSFYFSSQNTIYISFNELNAGMLAHEMGHALITHYFVVAPSPKVQEVLTGYVEYSIRKATGTLPEIRK